MPERTEKTANKVQLSFRLEQDLRNRFSGLVKGSGKDVQEVLRDFVEHCVRSNTLLTKVDIADTPGSDKIKPAKPMNSAETNSNGPTHQDATEEGQVLAKIAEIKTINVEGFNGIKDSIRELVARVQEVRGLVQPAARKSSAQRRPRKPRTKSKAVG